MTHPDCIVILQSFSDTRAVMNEGNIKSLKEFSWSDTRELEKVR